MKRKIENKKIIGSKEISDLFGLSSKFYNETAKFLKKQEQLKKVEFQKKYRRWESNFKNIYGNEINTSLFLKHSYFASILKSLIIVKARDLEESILFEKDYLPEFEYFFCPDLEKDKIDKINISLKNSLFSQQDIFQELYQQFFLVITRHKIGEFYTPPYLVKKMIEDVYVVGNKTLDPSCGSGSFLIELIVKILNSNIKKSLKSEAIEKIFGFDINPLATLTVKINILLLLIEVYKEELNNLPKINIFLMDALFPNQYEKNLGINLSELFNSFDLIIGNPPWLTYKDINNKKYQVKIRTLAETLGIKPQSQYITHIELASVFFYAIPLSYLKNGGKIFFVITKSVLNGDHCFKFRAFSIFNMIEIWDFPNSKIFNVEHICLKAEFIGKNTKIKISEKYPIKTKIYDSNLELQKSTRYTSLEFDENGAKIILPEEEIKFLNVLSQSEYKSKFFQGATLVPRSLVFFKTSKIDGDYLYISSDPEATSRIKKKWKYCFQNVKIENKFRFKTFLNKDLVPFYIKQFKEVFLPINQDFKLDDNHLRENPRALDFYDKLNNFYQENKKETSAIKTLFSNLNYWNKLTKQVSNKQYIVVYNASGSRLKSAVIDNEEKAIVICSENYYYSTASQNEAYYLSAIFNSPIFSKNIKIIKSSRHIHKRPFSFPIPPYDPENELHRTLAKKSQKYHSIVQDLVHNNPKITSEKVKMFITQKLIKLDNLTKEVVFKI
ncbi:MAG: N-6 DNA methylase [Candidatus Lokiarchaeota archaeon]|nr:N-6 DNA methylase [Candidatus Lokiarchaeota archaeon]